MVAEIEMHFIELTFLIPEHAGLFQHSSSGKSVCHGHAEAAVSFEVSP